MVMIRKKNCLYTLEAKVMTFGVQKHRGSEQVVLNQLDSKQVGFKQLGRGVETRVHVVHDEKHVWFEVELQGAQGDREAEFFQVKEQGKVHLDIKVEANIMVTRVPVEEGAEGNVAKKKKVKESKKGSEKLDWDSFLGDLPRRQRRAHIVSVNGLSATVEAFLGRHVVRESGVKKTN
ncbi:hypothetical protein Tco_0960624 [Tanacetum coccineum]